MTESRLWPDILESLLQAARQRPSCKAEIREDFLGALSRMLDELSGLAKDSTTLQIFYETAHGVLKSFAGDEVVLTMLGVKCLDEGMYQQARHFLQAALEVNPDCLSAKENLRTVFDRVVDRWHFLMLNDITRNSAYHQAIQTAVARIPRCKVLDIGSGTGILSMMAARQGADEVYACELSETMVTMSHDILAANGLQDDVTVIHALSTNLSVPRDLPERISLVVTEIVDAGLLGERIIPTLRHAWRELLLPKQPDLTVSTNQIQPSIGGRVIPCGATVYAMVIECPEIRRQSRLLSREVAGLSFGSRQLEGSCKAAEGKSLSDTPSLSSSVGGAALTKEPYTCERLAQIRGGFRALTRGQQVLEFDFDNPEIPLPPESHLHLPVLSDGMVDAVAVWFELHLDSEVSISTAPSWDISWEQALFPVPRKMEVQRGDSLQLLASCSDILLSVEVEVSSKVAFLSETGERDQPLVDVETVDKTVLQLEMKQLMAGGSIEHVLPNQDNGGRMGHAEMEELAATAASAPSLRNFPHSDNYFVERGELSRLNDSVFMGAYRKAVAQALQVMRETSSSSSSEDSELEEGMTHMILDPPEESLNSDSFGDPVFSQGLGSTDARMDSGDEDSGSEECADCIVLDMVQGLSLFGLMAAKEGADFIQIARTSNTYKFLIEDLAEWNEIKNKVSFRYLELSRIPAAQPMWDIVICDIVSPQGVLRSGVFEELAFLSSHHLHSESLLVPSHLVLQATCLSSAALRARASLLGSIPTLGFDIAPFLNHYEVSHFIDVDLCTLPHEVLTEGFQLLSLDLKKAPVKEEARVKVQVKSTGTITGIAYWFTLQLHGDVVVTTAPGAYPESHWHQAVFLLPEDLAVERGQTLEIRGLLQDSCIDILISHNNIAAFSDVS